MWSNTETEVVYHWLVHDKRLLDHLDDLKAGLLAQDGTTLDLAASELKQRVMRRVLAWHNDRSHARIGYTHAIRALYAVVFYPHPREVAKKIVWKELVQNHSDALVAEHLDESGEVSL